MFVCMRVWELMNSGGGGAFVCVNSISFPFQDFDIRDWVISILFFFNCFW